MFHKIEKVIPLSDFKLEVQFSEGIVKLYDVKPLFERISVFKNFIYCPEHFFDVTVDIGGYGVIWNEKLDLSCEELWKNGQTLYNR